MQSRTEIEAPILEVVPFRYDAAILWLEYVEAIRLIRKYERSFHLPRRVFRFE